MICSFCHRTDLTFAPGERFDSSPPRLVSHVFVVRVGGLPEQVSPCPNVQAKTSEEERWHHFHTMDLSQDTGMVCLFSPPGWYCSRAGGHDGPCAALPACGSCGGKNTKLEIDGYFCGDCGRVV